MKGELGREKMKTLDVLAAVLVVVGALNWGSVSVARFDLVAAIFGMHFGQTSVLSSFVYGLVGLSGLYQALSWKAILRYRRFAPDQNCAARREAP